MILSTVLVWVFVSINLMIYVLCFMQREDLVKIGVSATVLDKFTDACGVTCLAVLSFPNTCSCILFEWKQVLCDPTFIILVL
jgi:hypothetical protein